MPRKLSDSSTSSASDSAHPLAERVRARVAEVSVALQRRTRASKRGAKRAQPKRGMPPQAPAAKSPEQIREDRSLTRVFNELAVTHRQHRQRTGQHASPALRDAAQAFKESPSLPLLVIVAGFLEEDGLLAW